MNHLFFCQYLLLLIAIFCFQLSDCFSLLAPHISWGIMWEITKLWMKGCNVIILDIPLLFETKMDRWTNPVTVVWVNPETQIQRLMSRDECSEEQAQNRINAQLALEWKKSEADIVIDNSGSLDDTRQHFREVLRKVSETLTWKERLRSRDGLISVVVCTAVSVLLARKNLLWSWWGFRKLKKTGMSF